MNRDKINRLITSIRNEISWIKAFNILEDDLIYKHLDKLVEVEKIKETEFNDSYVKFYELQDKIDNIDINNLPKFLNDVQLYSKKYLEISNEYQISLDKYLKKIDEIIECFKQYDKEFDNNLKLYVKDNETVDINLLFTRICLLNKKTRGMAKSMKLSDLAIDDIRLCVNDDIEILTRIATRKANKKLEQLELEQKKIKQRNKYKKIFDYKEMVKLAENNNYEYSRCCGDHAIYVHKDSFKIVVIPQHELGFGLMLDIQKQIKENKVA
ncbi:type II toxin-antitoxin system HicA family toxin [Clostridium botulinum]|nr:type II toxin-antitoxin system HicA family toxin [Clostridium botulinum]